MLPPGAPCARGRHARRGRTVTSGPRAASLRRAGDRAYVLDDVQRYGYRPGAGRNDDGEVEPGRGWEVGEAFGGVGEAGTAG